MRRRRSAQIDVMNMLTQWARDIFGAPPYLGVDLGSFNIRIYLESKGIILKEKIYVAKNKSKNEFVAAGDVAYEMLGKTPPNIEVFSPIEKGRISDFDGVLFLLKHTISKALEPYYKNQLSQRFNLVFAIPLGLTEVEEMAIVEAGKKSGAKEVFLIETPLASGFGLKAPVMENTGTFLVDVGGGTTEVALVSLGGVVLFKILKFGGIDFNKALINYLRLRYGLLIGEKTAEEIKLALGSVTETDKDYLEISGRSMENGMPKSINVKKKLLFEPLYPYYGQIIDLVREAVEETPPELIKDINSKGIILSGMSSGFLDLDTYFTRELRISVKKVSEPEYTVIRGLGFLIEHKDILEKIAVHFAKI